MRHTTYYDDSLDLKEDDASATVEIYVETAGSDSTGDGSVGNPYQTIGRAMRDVPVRSIYRREIYIGAGSFQFPLQANVIAHVNSHTFYGTTSVESSQTADVLVTSTEANGLRVQDVGMAWTPQEHVGKMIQWTSGAISGSHGVIYDNDADSIWVTMDKNTWTIPGVGDTFDILSRDTEVTLTTETGSEIVPFHRGNVAVQNAKLEFYDMKLSSTINTITGTVGTVQFRRCAVETMYLSAGNHSTTFAFTCYMRATKYWCITSGENAAWLMSGGCVIDSNSLQSQIRHNSTIRVRGETVFMNIPAGGFMIANTCITGENATGPMIRFYSCTAGFTSRQEYAAGTYIGAGNHVEGVNFYGTITNFLIEAGRNDRFFLGDTSSVSTQVGTGTNQCTVDKTNESYYSVARDTMIVGSGNDASVTIPADATTQDVSYQWDRCGSYVTSANSGATAITNFTNAVVGQRIIVRGGSATNSSTIADGGNFELVGGAGITLGVDVGIELYWDGAVWREISRRAA